MTTRTAPAIEVEIREVKPQPYLGCRIHAPLPEVGPRVQEGFARLYHRLAATGDSPVGPPFLIAARPKDGYLDVELGAPCAASPERSEGCEAGHLLGGKVAVTVHRGSYDSLGEVYERLAEWIAANGLRMGGPPREVYLTPPGEEPVTEVVWPLAATT